MGRLSASGPLGHLGAELARRSARRPRVRLRRDPWLSYTWVRVALSYVALALATAGIFGLLVGEDAAQRESAALAARLGDQARAVAYDAAPLLVAGAPLTATNALAHTLSGLFGTRVTLIRPDGVVVGDSEQAPQVMENHAGRAEVQDALAAPGSLGSSSRVSATVQRALLYIAVTVTDPAQPARVVGVARVAYSVASVDPARAALWGTVALAVLLVSLPATLFGVLLVRSIVGPLSVLSAVARRFGQGALETRAPSQAVGEIGELSREFNTMADQLSGTIRERTAERNQIAAVLAHMHDGVLVTDARGAVESVNAAAALLFGTQPEQAAHRSLIEVTHSHELHRALHAVLAHPGESRRLEIRVGAHQVESVVTAVPGIPPASTTGLIVLQDVTELRRLERARRDFVANIGHELRTPLASIKLLVETLIEAVHDDPPAAEEFLQRIDVEVDGLTQLVRELLELSKIESGQVQLARAALPVGPLLEHAAGRLRAQAERAGLTVTVADTVGLPLVDADSARVEQVLVNLVHNAIKFTPRGGCIIIAAVAGPPGVCISVADTGVGIPAEDLPRIFERFYKVDKARTGRDRDGGTGLGLAIAKHIVQAHGGQIWAESPPRQGATFFFTLSAASGPAA